MLIGVIDNGQLISKLVRRAEMTRIKSAADSFHQPRLISRGLESHSLWEHFLDDVVWLLVFVRSLTLQSYLVYRPNLLVTRSH